MKKQSLIIIFFLVAFFWQPFGEKVEAKHLAAPACSGYYGKFTATNWPKGAKVTVTCEGAGRQRGQCVGESTTLAPGQSFHFSHCNCLDKSMACIKVTGLPKGCTLKTKLACAANRQSVQDSITVACDGKGSNPTAKPTKPGAKPTAPNASGSAQPKPTVAIPTATPIATPTATPTFTPMPTPPLDTQTFQTPPWYCLALGNNFGDWVGCEKKAL